MNKWNDGLISNLSVAQYDGTMPDMGTSLFSAPADLTITAPLAQEVVFIEDNVLDMQILVDGVGAGREVHVLDSTRDGLSQIADVLSGRSGISALHLISHGSEASVNLGSLLLNESDLAAHAAELASIGRALAPDADILLYGCNIGAGQGAAFVDQLAVITGADIAASNNLTGAATLGGDWTLEVHSGDVSTAPVVSDAVAQSYLDVLNISAATLTFGTSGRFANNGGKTATGNVIYNVSGNSAYQLQFDGATRGVINYGNGYVLVDPTAANETSVTMSFAGSNTFTANALTVSNYEGNFAAQTIVFKGYDKNNAQVGSTQSVTVGKGVASSTINFSGLTNITTLKMTSTTNSNTIHYLTLDDFSLSNISLCYLRGTRILTPGGDIAVEDLRIGDALVSRLQGRRAIKWIGRQSYDLRFIRNNTGKLPVRIAAGALGHDLPVRDLLVSPGHSMLLGDTLVLASSLVNGITITQAPEDCSAEVIDYFQIEMESHDCILAEGSWSETFADGPGLRAAFHNAAEFAVLYPEYRTPEALTLCASRPERGAALDLALRPVVARAAGLVAPGALDGSIDRITQTDIEGWALDVANPDLPVLLEIVDGAGCVAHTVLACDFRADLRDAGKGSKRCAFSVTLAEALPAAMLPEMRVRRASDQALLPTSPTCRAGYLAVAGIRAAA